MEESFKIGDYVTVQPLEAIETFKPFKGEIIGFNAFMVTIKNLETNEECIVNEYQIKKYQKKIADWK